MLKIKWIDRKAHLPDKRHADPAGCVLAWHKYQGMMVTGARRVRECEYFTHWAPAIQGPYEIEPERKGCGVRGYDYRSGNYLENETEQDKRQSIYAEAGKWGMPASPGHIDMALKMEEEYGENWLFSAMERAATGNPMPTWGYVEGILKDWKRKGGMDERGTGRKQNYGRQVSAQQYQQRTYTEEELLRVSEDLIQEAREARGG